MGFDTDSTTVAMNQTHAHLFRKMVDNRTVDSRSALMARVRQKNTSPEMIVRRLLHRMGYRFRLHQKDLPGRPDIVLPRHKKVIFVHGCFWHRHDCKKATMPKTNQEFWKNKFQTNIDRDTKVLRSIKERGWETLIIWECEARDGDQLELRLLKFLGEK
jgi:DNA mismatch endonuclease, patch repair protein